MSSPVYRVENYQVGIEAINGFFGAWLKRNLFTRQRLMITGGIAVAIIAVTLWSLGVRYSSTLDLVQTGSVSPAIVVIGGLFSLVFYFLVVAVFIYGLSPLLTYGQILAGYWLGRVRHRRNNAEITAEGVAKTSDGVTHLTPWEKVHAVVATRKTILIFTNRNCAMMIPKAAFASPEAADAFVAAAESRHAGDTAGEPAAAF